MSQTLNIKRQLTINLSYCYSARSAAHTISASRMRFASRFAHQCSGQIHCFNKHLAWYELYFWKYNPLPPAPVTIGAGTLLAITRQLLQLKRSSNPLLILQVFSFRVKKIFRFGFGVLLGGRHKWGCFSVFMAYFTRPWTPIERANIFAQVFVEKLGYPMSL